MCKEKLLSVSVSMSLFSNTGGGVPGDNTGGGVTTDASMLLAVSVSLSSNTGGGMYEQLGRFEHGQHRAPAPLHHNKTQHNSEACPVVKTNQASDS